MAYKIYTMRVIIDLPSEVLYQLKDQATEAGRSRKKHIEAVLIENAVKHNIVSKQMPLVIDIFTTAGNKLIH